MAETPSKRHPKRVCARRRPDPPRPLENPFKTWLRPAEPTAQELEERAHRYVFELQLGPVPTDLDESDLFQLYLESERYQPTVRECMRAPKRAKFAIRFHEHQFRKYRPNHPANRDLMSYPASVRAITRYVPRTMADIPERRELERKWALERAQERARNGGKGYRGHLTEHEKQYERWRRRFDSRKQYQREYQRAYRAKRRALSPPPAPAPDAPYKRWLRTQRWRGKRPARSGLEHALRDPELLAMHRTELMSHPMVGPAAECAERDELWWAIAVGALRFDCSPRITKTIFRSIFG